MMQQRAMQQQMDEIVEYLQEINEKVDDILRAQKDAVLADMIGVDLIVEEALTVRDQVGRVSEVTWSKVQATGMTIARTQAYALRQLDTIADKLQTKADLGEIAKATAEAEPKVQRMARSARPHVPASGRGLGARTRPGPRCVTRRPRQPPPRLEDRPPEPTRAHRPQHRTHLDPDGPDDPEGELQSPVQPVRLSRRRQVEQSRRDRRPRLPRPARYRVGPRVEGREALGPSSHRGAGQSARVHVGRRYDRQSASELQTFDRTTEAFRAVDIDGDGIPDRPRAAAAAEEAGTAIKGAATGVAGAFGTLFKRKKGGGAPHTESNPGTATAEIPTAQPDTTQADRHAGTHVIPSNSPTSTWCFTLSFECRKAGS